MSKDVTKDEKRGLTIVRSRYSNLNQLICDLSIKLSEVSFNVDNEFLSAYRVHMVEVQEDLKSLKLQVKKNVLIDQGTNSIFKPLFDYNSSSIKFKINSPGRHS